MSPIKWLVTRQVAIILWYTGEIIADWYPLLRTHAIVKRTKAIFAVYITCLLFNLSKVALIVIYLNYSAGNMFNKDGAFDNVKSSRFYAVYYVIQLIIIYSSFFYDLSVYFVLKKCVFQKNKKQYQQGFLKKFKNLSEYRVLISALISTIFLPIISVAFIIKFYYQKKDYWALDFSFEESRKMITSVPYFMIFIDQILLATYKEESSSCNSNNITNSNTYYYSSSSNSATKYISGKSKYGLNPMGSLNNSETLKNDNYNLLEYPKNNIFNNSNNNNNNNNNIDIDISNEYNKNNNYNTNSYKNNNNYYNNNFNNTSFNNNNNNNTSFSNNTKSKRKVSDINIITHDEDISPTKTDDSNNIFNYYDDSLYYVNYKSYNHINNNLKYSNANNNYNYNYNINNGNNNSNNSKHYYNSLKHNNSYK